MAARLTDAAGASDFFIAGYVTYTEKQKQEILGVPAAMLRKYSAVSEQVAGGDGRGRPQDGADQPTRCRRQVMPDLLAERTQIQPVRYISR